MILRPRLRWRKVVAVFLLPVIFLASLFAYPLPPRVSPYAQAQAQVEPVATAVPEVCAHVATADTIRIYYCEESGLFVNQFGFMVFEP